MTYRDDVEALQQRVHALETDMNASARQLEEAQRLLDDARKRSSLPILDNLYVAAPCKASWDDMVGDDRSRFCGQCDKNVYNLSALTRPEAQALLIEKEGRLCVRYYQRADGTVLTADCPDGLRRRRRKKRVVAAAFGAMSAVAAAGALLHRGTRMGSPERVERPTTERPTIMMGEAPRPPVRVDDDARDPQGARGAVTGGVVAFAPPIMGKMSAPTMGHIRPATNATPEKAHHKKR